MADLTVEQLAFLRQHGVSADQVFDATGMRRQDYARSMKSLGALVAVGVSKCSHGHAMRLRSGHCVQCRPQGLAHLKRYQQSGRVYVAFSESGQLAKVGTADVPAERVAVLNTHAYGGFTDWELKFSLQTERAGRVEHLAHVHLQGYQAWGRKYWKDGRDQSCNELFECDVNLAIEAVQEAAEYDRVLSQA